MKSIEILIIFLVILLALVVIRPFVEPSIESVLNQTGTTGGVSQEKNLCGAIDSSDLSPVFPQEATKGEYVYKTSMQLPGGSYQPVFFNLKTKQLLVSIPIVSGCIVEVDPQDGSKGPKFPTFLADKKYSNISTFPVREMR